MNQAQQMKRAAQQYDRRILVLENCIHWIRQQETRDAALMHRTLVRQWEDMKHQRRTLFLLVDTLQCICDKYGRTEQRILDSQEIYREITGVISAVDLISIREQLQDLFGIVEIR